MAPAINTEHHLIRNIASEIAELEKDSRSDDPPPDMMQSANRCLISIKTGSVRIEKRNPN